jgi:hypothetical protein
MKTMESPSTFVREEDGVRGSTSSVSAVSWGAIFAGASVAAAVSLVLLTLALGFGALRVATWPYVSGTDVAVAAAIALIVMQWVSAAFGGYITGRLRTRWVGLHTHEVFFRDTAHGFITWSVATLVVALFFASAAGTAVRAGQDSEALSLMPQPHSEALVEHASWRDRNELTTSGARHQATLQQDPLGERPGEIASRSVASSSIWVALSMLIGAFIASASAALGGRLRDHHP